MNTASSSSSRFENLSPRRRRILLATVLVTIFLVLALLAEGAVRVRQWVKYGKFERVEDTYVYDEASRQRILRAGWTNGQIVINSHGFRSPEISEQRAPNSIRIAFLGASTTYSAEVSSNEATWAHLVAEKLRAHAPDVSVDYINAGVPGYGVRNSLRMLTNRVARFEPNLIVIYHATNDLSSNAFLEAKKQGLITRRSEEELSWLSQYSLLWYLVEKNLRILAIQQTADDSNIKLELNPDEITVLFRKHVREIVQASTDVAPLVALATFSTQLRAEQSPEQLKRAATTSSYYMPFLSVEDILAGFAIYNDVLREVAEESDVVLIGNELSVPGDSVHFADSVHFTDQGSRVMAERIVEGLVSSPQFEDFLDSVRSE